MVSSFTDPTVAQKYPLAHRCCPQYFFLNGSTLFAVIEKIYLLDTARFSIVPSLEDTILVDGYDLFLHYLLQSLDLGSNSIVG
jgi:hypothetical protein